MRAKQKKVRVTFTLEKHYYDILCAMTKERGLTKSELIEEILIKYLAMKRHED